MENIEKFSLLDDKPTMATDHTEVSGERDALDIGMEYNDNKADGFAQCVLDDIFGQGYLLAKSHLGSRMPENPYPESIFTPVTRKEIRKAVKLLKDNGYSPNCLFAHWGRSVWDNCIESLKSLQQETNKQK